MFNKRTARSANRRLRLEFLETREVPDGTPTIDPLPPDTTIPVQMPVDPKPVDPATDGSDLEDPDVIFTTTSVPDSPAVDLAASMTVDRPKPSVGDVVILKLTIANTGPVQATNVGATVTLPAGMTFVSSDAPTTFDPATGAWSAGTIATAGKAVLAIKAKVIESADQSVTATISGADQTDSNPENNSATVSVAPVLARLNLMKSFSSTSVGVGSSVVMALAIGNGGQGRARNVTVTSVLPEGMTFVKALSATQGNYNASTQTWNVGTVAPGTIPVLRVLVLVTKVGRMESPSTAAGSGFNTETSKLEKTGVINVVKPSGPATWAFFGGPGFSISPGPVPAMAAASWSGSIVNNQFLAARGFLMNGFKLV